MKKARIVAGAIVEGDGDGDDGNAGEWIALVLMLEEVSRGRGGGAAGQGGPGPARTTPSLPGGRAHRTECLTLPFPCAGFPGCVPHPARAQYLDGTEVDVDLVFDNGVPVYGAITVRHLPPACIGWACRLDTGSKHN